MRVCDERTTLRIDNNLRKLMKLKWKEDIIYDY